MENCGVFIENRRKSVDPLAQRRDGTQEIEMARLFKTLVRKEIYI